jgi:hypothetical protein
VVAAAPFFVTPTPATATPIVYTLSDVTETLDFPSETGTITFTGTFTFDQTPTPTLVSIDVTATALPTSLLTHSPETTNEPLGNIIDSRSFVGVAAATGDQFQFVFASPLGSAPDLITDMNLQLPSRQDFGPAQVTGSADPTPTPEPASLTLLGGALALFLVARRAKWRGRRAPISGVIAASAFGPSSRLNR